MRIALAIVAVIAWALWTGGLVSLFIFAPALFAANHGHSAPILFQAFERYQLVLAGLALLATILWRITARSPLISVVLVFLVIAGVGAVVSPTLITSQMESLRLAGRTDNPEFRQLHGYSMMLYLAQGVALLVCGGLLPLALRNGTTPHATPPHLAEAT